MRCNQTSRGGVSNGGSGQPRSRDDFPVNPGPDPGSRSHKEAQPL